MINKYPLVYVVWEDHIGDSAWRCAEEVTNKPSICHSVGWEFMSDDKNLTLIGSIAGETVGDILTIVKSCIVEYKVLRKAKPASKHARVQTGVAPNGA